MSDRPLFTIGYSTRSSQACLGLLRAQDVEVVADVWFQPYSGRFSDLSRPSLEAALKAAELRLMSEEGFEPRQLDFLSELAGESALDLAYAARGEKIAYRENESSDEGLYDRLHAEER